MSEDSVESKRYQCTSIPLSGGNQQKVVFTSLNCDLKVLILDEPTKGIDVGANIPFMRLRNELTANGYDHYGIFEMPEVLGMADRIVVMRSLLSRSLCIKLSNYSGDDPRGIVEA